MVRAKAQPGGLLFLDISLATGWVYGGREHIAPPGPIWGKWNLPKFPDLGRRIVALENELSFALSRYEPGKVGIEAPLEFGAKGSFHTARLLLCLAGAVEAITYRWEKQYIERSVTTARTAVCGRARMNSDETAAGTDVKRAIVAPWIADMQWDIPDADAADAAVGWAYEMGIRFDKKRLTA